MNYEAAAVIGKLIKRRYEFGNAFSFRISSRWHSFFQQLVFLCGFHGHSFQVVVVGQKVVSDWPQVFKSFHISGLTKLFLAKRTFSLDLPMPSVLNRELATL